LPFSEKSNIDVLMTILASVMLFTFILVGHGRKISKAEGIFFIGIYVAYVTYLLTNL